MDLSRFARFCEVNVSMSTVDANTGPKPLISHRRSAGQMIVLKAFLLIPFVALVVSVPTAWGWGLSWLDLVLAAVFYVVATLVFVVLMSLHEPRHMLGTLATVAVGVMIWPLLRVRR